MYYLIWSTRQSLVLVLSIPIVQNLYIYVDCGGHILHVYKTISYYSTIMDNIVKSFYGKPFHFQNSILPLHFLIEASIPIPFYSHSFRNLIVLEELKWMFFGIPLGIPIHVLVFPTRHKCLNRIPISSSSSANLPKWSTDP